MIEQQIGRYLSAKIEISPYFSGTGDFRVLFLNTNPYSVGVVNLGWQTVVEYLLVACPFVSVRVEYADTIGSAHFKPLDFDLAAIHIPFETNYSTAVWMLNRIGLPLFSRERSNSFPIVVAGGVYNPFPLVDFIDVFVLGDGRLPIVELTNLCFGEKGDKQKILEIASEKKSRGIFIPELHSIQEKISASPELPLNEFPIHTIWSSKDNVYGLPPDYLSIMVALGCRYKCPFCLVSHCQGIGRDRETEIDTSRILEILNWRRQFISLKTVKLFFASSVEREKLKRMISELIKERVNVEVGSLNCQQIDDEIVALLKQSGQNRITIAPETNWNQRWKVGKEYITDERIFEIVKLANKYDLSLSLYLMYGLPGETEKDIIEVGRLVKKVRQILNSNLEMQVHCNQVYMKPHTPWQYAEQISPAENMRRFNLFSREFIGMPKIEVKTLDICSSILQSLLARGDRRMSKLLVSLAFSPLYDPRELMKRIEKLIPGWQRYFTEGELSEKPWLQIIFQDHKILWQRWTVFKERLKQKRGEQL
ncbi:MAG: radical SAM protein [Candidatus Aenigmarchaeota archaeon]|nr:radical SAM protein [Candidatus Aenigmarchaeota archaeon]